MDGTAQGEVVLKRRPEAVAEARRFVRLTVGRWEMDDFAPCLVASELVTNAVRHAGGDDVTLRLSLAGGGVVWVEVEDSAGDLPRARRVEPGGEAGRGLVIVERLARHWGVRLLGGGSGKVVFAVVEP